MSNENILLRDYFMKFYSCPVLLDGCSYESKEYQDMMKMALDRGKELSFEEVLDYMDNKFDLISPENDDDLSESR